MSLWAWLADGLTEHMRNNLLRACVRKQLDITFYWRHTKERASMRALLDRGLITFEGHATDEGLKVAEVIVRWC